MKKPPIGIQTFEKIINGNYVYIDKTEMALNLVDNYTYTFLSRPRRFGKSLFLDTLQELFEGNRKLFKGLYIYDKWDWSTQYPVIKISWDGQLRSINELKKVAMHNIKKNQNRLDIVCEEQESVSVCLDELIIKTSKKYNRRVVILIDEYDKPILDNLDQPEVAKESREFIKGLYSTLKGADRYIKFALLTGVSKFSRASIFSGLNMLSDISLNKRYGNICGYTQNDIETSFKELLADTDMKKLKEWYNGYNFLGDSLYNPFDILQFISNQKEFDNYWFSTGTPSFLIKLIQKNGYFFPKLANLVVGKELLNSFEIDNIDLEVILFQSGYLTIEKEIEKPRGGYEYKLKIPNREVKISLYDYLIEQLIKHKDRNSLQDRIYDSLNSGNLDEFEQTLKSIFASIPYNNYSNNTIAHFEGFYASVIYIYLQSLGIDIIGEDVTNRGRIDLTLKIAETIYIIEFKVGDSDALHQIKTKNYALKYIHEEKNIYLVGINFSEKEKNISHFQWEKI
jgi:hypothetical protein